MALDLEHQGACLTGRITKGDRIVCARTALLRIAEHASVQPLGIAEDIVQVSTSSAPVDLILSAPNGALPHALAIEGEWLVRKTSIVALEGELSLGAPGELCAAFARDQRRQWTKINGRGQLWLAGEGALSEMALNANYRLNLGRILAFQPSLKPTRAVRVGGAFSRLFGSETLHEFSGEGVLLIQAGDADGDPRWFGSQMQPRR